MSSLRLIVLPVPVPAVVSVVEVVVVPVEELAVVSVVLLVVVGSVVWGESCVMLIRLP